MTTRAIYGIGHTSTLIPPNDERSFFEHVGLPFAPETGDCQMRTAWWLAEAALLAYGDPAYVVDQFEATGFTCTPYDTCSPACYIAHTSEYVIIAFGGTGFISMKDWTLNIRAKTEPWPYGGKVHQGFQALTNELWENTGFGKHLTELREDPDRTFWFTGQSLGAALATLATDRFYHESPTSEENDRIGLYTFGGPRMGNKHFADRFPVRTVYRFVNNRDYVPHILPNLLVPNSWFRGYTHVGHLKYIDSTGYIHPEKPGWFFRLKDCLASPYRGWKDDENSSYRSVFLVYLFFEWLIDHSPVLYAHRIWNFLMKSPES